MPTANVFTAILGHEKIKWDATWNFLGWLFDPDEGHGLAGGIISRHSHHLYGTALTTCEPKPEDNLGEAEDGKSRWVDLTLSFPSRGNPSQVVVMDDVDLRSPGSMRKLKNLRAYGVLAKKHHPGADVRVVAVTNAAHEPSLAKVRTKMSEHLGPENTLQAGGIRWHLLSLATIGEWVEFSVPDAHTDSKASALLGDFIEWSRSLDGSTSS